jgi:transposase-like protein
MLITTGAWRRDMAGMQQRRLEAAHMVAYSATQAEVVRTFGVSRQAASVWSRQWHDGGEPALRGAGRVGRRPQLRPAELDAVEGLHWYRSATSWTAGTSRAGWRR